MVWRYFFVYGVLVFSFLLGMEDSRALKLKFDKMEKEQRVALIIGNSDYKSDVLPRLRNPKNDARLIRDILEEKGFKIVYLENATRKKIKRSVRKFTNYLKKGGVGFFYYAGHGIQVKGLNYLIPIGADIKDEADVEDEAISLNYVTDMMKTAGNRLNILVLDACRSNPFHRGGNGGLAPVSNAKGMFIAYATEAGSVASDGSGKNGPFTKYLVKHIMEPLPIEQVFKKVRVDVIKDTNGEQNPGVYNQITGDFYFTIPKLSKNDSEGESTWNIIKNLKSVEVFHNFIRNFPNSSHINEAKMKIESLSGSSDNQLYNKEKPFKPFYDSFRDNRNNWDLDFFKTISNGDFIFNTISNSGISISVKNIYVKNNFFIETSARHIYGNRKFAYGIIFFVNDSTFFYFGISKNGSYVYGYIVNNRVKKEKWHRSFAIKRFGDNVLRIEKRANYIDLFINEKKVKSLYFNNTVSKIGLFADSSQKISFHYLRVDLIKNRGNSLKFQDNKEEKKPYFNPFEN